MGREKKSNILPAHEMRFTRYSLDEYGKEHKVFTMNLEKYNFEIFMLFVQFFLFPSFLSHPCSSYVLSLSLSL